MKRSSSKALKAGAALLLACGLTVQANAYVLENCSWNYTKSISMQVNLDATAYRLDNRSQRPPLWSGAPNNYSVFASAAAAWNTNIYNFSIQPYLGNNPSCAG